MKAVWGLDYDYRTDKNFRRPSCPECNAPVVKFESGEYRCVSCREKFDIDDPRMLKWLADREEEKVVMEDCHKWVLPDGWTVGCGGKACCETHYVRNDVTLEWQVAWSECKNCGARTIV